MAGGSTERTDSSVERAPFFFLKEKEEPREQDRNIRASLCELRCPCSCSSRNNDLLQAGCGASEVSLFLASLFSSSSGNGACQGESSGIAN